MDDLISRQTAIDALGEEPEVWSGKDEYEQGLNNQWHYDVNALKALPPAEPIILDDGTLTITVQHGMLSKVNRVIVDEVGTGFCKMMYQDALPSAQQWIPCSERLPEEGKEVLISSDSGIYIAELEILDGNVYWNETIEYRSVKRVSAWCPLPEPYKEKDNG